MRSASRGAAASPLSKIVLTALTAAGLVTATAVAPVAAAEPVLSVGVGGVLTLPAGDGFNDTARVSISSDSAVTVNPVVLNGESVLTDLDDVVLTDDDGDGTFTGSVVLAAAEFAAGTYTVEVSETSGRAAPATAPLKVGTGKIVDTTVAASPTFFPYKDGYLDTVKATVTAFDETDTALPFSGNVTVTKGSVTTSPKPIASTTGAKASALVSITSLPVGTASVNADITGPDGTFTLAQQPITLAYTKVTGLGVTKNISTVFPAVDNYQDTASIKVIPTSSTGTAIPVTGKVAIRLNGKTVKSWTLTSSASKTFTWNGLNGGKIVPGKYTVTVSAKGPQGSTATASMYLNVSSKKLVTKTFTRTVDAKPVFKSWSAYDELGECWYDDKARVSCDSYAGDPALGGLSLIELGSFTVPEEYRRFAASVRVTANVDLLVGGGAAWNAYQGLEDGVWGEVAVGNNTLEWLKLDTSLDQVSIDFLLLEYTSVDIDYYKIEYRYKALQ